MRPVRLGVSVMVYVYVLYSRTLGKRYVGSAKDLAVRLAQHNRGASRFTSGGIPWVLIHSESFATASEARRRELFLKSGAGRAWLDRLIGSSAP